MKAKTKTLKGAVESATSISPDKDGELDDLISAIKTGKAFFTQDFTPQKRQRNKASVSKPVAEAIGDILTVDSQQQGSKKSQPRRPSKGNQI